MSEYLDILAQKYLAGDCSSEELKEVDGLQNDTYWLDLLEKYRELDHDLKKRAFLSQSKKVITSKSRNRSRGLIVLAAVAAAVIGVLVVPRMADDEPKDQMAKHTSEKKEDSKAAEAEVSTEDATEGAAEDPGDKEADEEYRDVEIVKNQSIYNFEPINNAFKVLKENNQSLELGIVRLIKESGDTDSVYVFSVNYDAIKYEKHLRYVGAIGDNHLFNLLSYKGEEREVRRSILIFNQTLEYYGRFVVSTVDHLPDYIQSDQLVFENIGVNNSKFVSKFDLDHHDCIDLPDGMTSCLSKF